MATKMKNLIVGFPLYDGGNMMNFVGASEVFVDTLGFVIG